MIKNLPNLLALILCLLFSTSLFAQNSIKLAETVDVSDEHIEIPGVKNFQLIKITADDAAVISNAAEQGSKLAIQFGTNSDQEVGFYINQYSELTSYRGNNDIQTYRGWSSRNELISLTVAKDFVYGFFDKQGERYNIEPAWYYDAAMQSGNYVMYKSSDVNFESLGTCGFEESKHRMKGLTPEPGTRRLGQCYGVEMAIASDFSMFQKYGSAANVEMHNIGVMNDVQTNYMGSFDDDIEFQIITQFVSTCNTCDPWTASTDPGDLLDDFRAWGNGNGFGTTSYDVGQHWSDRNFDGSTIGLAWVGGLCGFSRYHVLQDFSSNADGLRVLTAHELGHNFDATHDADNSPHIMAPSVQNTTTWSNASISDMSNFIAFRAGQGCFSACNGGGGGNPPDADFTVYEDDLCEGSSVNFYDLSTNTPIAWNWSFTGGTPSFSQEQHPNITYAFPGNYSVELTVTNADGNDTEVKNGYISVGNGSNQIILYEDFDNGFGLWSVDNPDNGREWELAPAGGTISGTMTAKFDNATSFNVGARDGLVSPIFSLAGHTFADLNLEYAYSRPVPLGQDSLVIQMSTDGGASYTRVAGFAENGTNNFATAGSVAGAFTPANRNDWCGDGFNQCLQVDLSTYAGLSNLVLKIENVTGNGNNIYLDRIAIVADCYDLNPPIVDFSSDVQSGCVPLTVQYMDESTNSPSAWNWTFDGAQIPASNIQNPTATYDVPGLFEVILVATNAAGSGAESKLDYMEVLSEPIVDFGTTVTGNTVVFTNTTLFGDTYMWDFGDGETSDLEQPTHTYDNGGTYNVTLTVMNTCGSKNVSNMVSIISAFQASFDADTISGCAPLTVVFENTSSAGATSWAWSFEGGNPSASSMENPSITYNTAGEFNVTLIISDGTENDTLTMDNYISVGDVPSGDFTFTRNILEASFNATVFGQNYISWDFGDGSAGSNDEDPSHIYSTEGAYMVTMEAGNDCDTLRITKEVYVFDIPMATFNSSVTSLCEQEDVTFTASPTGDSLTYAWTFDGGSPSMSADASPVITYSTSGTYNVELTVSSPSGSGIAMPSTIVVTPRTSSGFTVNYQSGDSLFIEENALDQDTFIWEFNGAYLSSDPLLELTDIVPGTHELCLITMNNCNQDTACHSFTVEPSATSNIRDLGMSVYPNPSSGDFIFSSDRTLENIEVKLFSSKGSLVDVQFLDMKHGKDTLKTDVESGVYFITFEVKGDRFVQKLVVLK